MNITVVSAVNDQELYRRCLLASPGISRATEVIALTGHSRPGNAYNSVLVRTRADYVIFAHQDVYLPPAWFEQTQRAIELLNRHDSAWAIAGVLGIHADGGSHGHIYCTGNNRVIGGPLARPVRVVSLDECVLIVRRNAGLTFDERLPGFHFYGTDLCMEAQRLARAAYVIPAFCIHNTNGYAMFPRSFWQCYLFMRRKWRRHLPLHTPCITIRRPLTSVAASISRRFLWLKLGRPRLGRRDANPASLYDRLLAGDEQLRRVSLA